MQLCDLSDQRVAEFTDGERLLEFTNIQQKMLHLQLNTFFAIVS